MKDREARNRIDALKQYLNITVQHSPYTNYNYQYKSLKIDSLQEFVLGLSEKFNLLMTHLGLEFEEVKAGVRVRKKR